MAYKGYKMTVIFWLAYDLYRHPSPLLTIIGPDERISAIRVIFLSLRVRRVIFLIVKILYGWDKQTLDLAT